MIRKHIERGKLVDGPAPWNYQTRALLPTKIANLRASRKLYKVEGGAATDNPRLARLAEIAAPNYVRGAWLEENPGVRLRPRSGLVVAQRRSPFEWAKAAGIVIPEVVDWEHEQLRAAEYDVLFIAANVESVRPGDVVLASAFTGTPLRGFGRDVFALKAPEFVCPAHEHRNLAAYRAGCECTGEILAVVDTGADCGSD